MTTLMATARSRARLAIAKFSCNREGVAAIEFAMILPIMVMMFIGAVEMSQAVTVDRRVSQMASSTADLVARADKNITCSELHDILNASSWIMKPYKPNGVKITVRNIVNTGAQNLETWKVQYTGPLVSGSGSDPCPPLSCPPPGQATAPSPQPAPGLISNGGGLVVVDVAYDYKPLVFDFFMKTGATSIKNGANYTLKETSNHPPRSNSAKLELPNGTKCGE
jgi:Flp pilus assembly pilin Flp